MKTDFISKKERVRFDSEFAYQIAEHDNIDTAINNLQCAQHNKRNKDYRNKQILDAIELLKKELH